MRYTFNMVKNVAIVLAGGTGNRMGLDIPKQFLILSGRSVLEHSIDAFERNPLIDEILIVANANYINDTQQIIDKNNWKKIKGVVPGGKERYDSSLAAISEYRGTLNVNLIFHDAVRPLVSQRIITDCVKALEGNSAVGVAIPCVDTIMYVEEGVIKSVPDRTKLWRAQTPQGFRLDVITEAYNIALQDPAFKATDDCGVLMRYMPHVPIVVVNGDEHNLKLTYKGDIPLFERLIEEHVND